MQLSQIRIRPLAAVILWLWTASFCWAATLEEATSAKDRGDFAVAFSQLKQLAASGDAAAQFQLSLLWPAASASLGMVVTVIAVRSLVGQELPALIRLTVLGASGW